MTYKLVDTLTGYQLEPGDVISVNYDDEDHLVTIKSIDYLKEGYMISFLDEYEDELMTYQLNENDEVGLYMFDDE